MTQITTNRHQRRAAAAQQRRILGANGLPAGETPQIARAGRHQVGMSFGIGPAGVAIVLAMGNGQVLTIPMPAEAADQAGMNLIRLAHQFRLMQVADQAEAKAAGELPVNHDHDDLLEEATRNVQEKTDASDQDQEPESPGQEAAPYSAGAQCESGPVIRLQPDRGPDHPHAGAIRGPEAGGDRADDHDPAGGV